MARDLVALAAESEDDANLLLNQFRENMKLRANVITVKPDEGMQNSYSPDEKNLEYFNQHEKEYDFKGYLSEMFTAPNPIKAYLCKQYSLHKIPIFGTKAEPHTQTLVERGIGLFYIGDMRNATMTSKYGNNQKSTLSNRSTSKNWMHISLDKEQIRQVDAEFKKYQNEHTTVHSKMRQDIENQKKSERVVEAKKKELKELQQKFQYKKVLKGKLVAKMDQMRNLEKDANIVDVEKERNRINKEKRNHISQCVRLNSDLKNLLGM